MLSGYKILDLTGELGPLAAKMLGDLGADVIKIEKPEGSPERSLKPFYHDEPGIENSLVYWAYNTGKKGITLNLETEKGKELFLKLAKDADAVIESFDPGYMDSLGLGYEDLKKINPKLVYTAITPYGQDGPYVDQHWKYNDLSLWAMGGTMASAGYPDRPPVRISTHVVNTFGGHHGALGTMTALYGADATGEGCKVDVSTLDAVSRHILGEIPAWVYHKRFMVRRGPKQPRGPVIVRMSWECKDGNVACRLSGGRTIRTLKTLMEWIIEEGEGEVLKKYSFDNIDLVDQAVVDEIEGCMSDFFMKRTKDELFTEALKRHFDLVAVQDAGDIVVDKQLEFRKFWSELEHEDLGETFKYPGTYFLSTEGRWAPTKRAPHLGEHNAEVYGALGVSADELRELKEGGVI